MPANKTTNESNPKPMRYMAIAFVVLALTLLVISAYSFLGARQVQQDYNRMVADSLHKLELINSLHYHEDLIYKNTMRHLQSTDTALLAKLERTIVTTNALVTSELDTLQKLVSIPERKDVLENYASDRESYIARLFSLLAKSRRNQQKDSTVSEIDALLPGFLEHQLILSSLGDSISLTTRQRGNEALQTIDSAIRNYNLLLLAALIVIALAIFLIRRVMQQLRIHDTLLSSEIKQREQLKEAFNESLLMYRTLFRNISIPMWIFDQKTLKIMDVNNAALKEYGYSREEFLALTILDLQPENQKEELKQLIPKLKETLSVYPNWKHQRKDGSQFFVDIKSHSLPPQTDASPRIVVAINIDDRVNAIKELERREKQLFEVSSSIPGAIYQFQMDIDYNFSVPFAGEGVTKLYNLRPEEVMADPSLFFDKVHPDDRAALWESIMESYQTMQPWEFEFRTWQSEKNKYIWLKGNSLPTRKEQGTVTWNGTLIDISSQREAQEKLIASEVNMRYLLNSSPQAIYLLDNQLHIIAFNSKAAEEVNNIQLKTLQVGESILSYISPTQTDNTIAYHKKALEGEVTVYETFNSGTWHEVAFRPVLDSNQQVLAVALSIQDISEQKHILEAIKHNEMQLARAQELSQIGNWEFDLITGKVIWSENLYKIYSVTPETFTPTRTTIRQLVHPDDLQMVLDSYEKAYATGDPAQIEHRVITPAGEERTIIQVGEVIFDEYRKPVKLSGTVQDITERKRVEREVTEAKNLLQSIIENIPEIIFSTDESFNITYISPQCLNILGYTDTELTGNVDLWTKNIYPEDLPLMDEIVQRLYKGEKLQYEIRVISRDKQIKWLFLRLSPTMNEEKRFVRLDGSASDMTQYKLAEAKRDELNEQLISQNNNLQQFAYIVSHNLRAPIANILGLTSIYNKAKPESSVNQRVIDNMFKSAQLLDRTIRDLNELLSLRSEQHNNLQEVTYFKDILEHIIKSLEEEIKEAEATIETDFEQAPVIVTTRSYLQSIILNLITNALKYRENSRKLNIKLKTFVVDDYICLQVSDNGLGINLQKEGDKIFGLYKRFHPTIAGKGIGLHLVKTQAELLGGKVEVESSVGVGTVFSVYFLNSNVVHEHIKKSSIN